jgi:acyl-coenzyme A thioesterase PaaI-like protein
MFKLSSRTKMKLINFYPPYIGAGIKVTFISDDFHRIDVRMKMHWWNKNLFGTHFGGSLSSMTDPFYVFILMMYLGKAYIVWDKSSKIEFIKPGKGTVKCSFQLSPEQLTEIKSQVDQKGKYVTPLPVIITNEQEEVVARVEKELYIRKRN